MPPVQQNINKLYAGESKGYSIDLAPRLEDTSRNPSSFQENTKKLMKHIEHIHQQFTDGTECHHIFKIGKTFVDQKAKQEFDPNNADTWDCTGIANRYSTYGNAISALIVFYAFTEEDVPDKEHNTYGMDSQFLALAYERALKERCKDKRSEYHALTRNEGEGMTTKPHQAFVLYVAVANRLACGCEACDDCVAGDCDNHGIPFHQSCRFCNIAMCRKHFGGANCDACGEDICEDCKDEDPRCPNCDCYLCAACSVLGECASARCSSVQCERCSESQKWQNCDKCNREFCEKCTFTNCGICNVKLCDDDCATQLRICGCREIICSDCEEYCDDCDQIYCEKCDHEKTCVQRNVAKLNIKH